MKSHVEHVLGHIKKNNSNRRMPTIRVAKHKCQGGCGHEQTANHSYSALLTKFKDKPKVGEYGFLIIHGSKLLSTNSSK